MKVHELLSQPNSWTKGVNARNSESKPIGAFHPEAVSFCLLGAITRCYLTDKESTGYMQTINKLLDTLQAKYNTNNIAGFNDQFDTTHEKVLELCKLADI